jgi:hypothetical protein
MKRKETGEKPKGAYWTNRDELCRQLKTGSNARWKWTTDYSDADTTMYRKTALMFADA